MSYTLLQQTAFTAYRCCICGWRLVFSDGEIGISGICAECAEENQNNPGYLPIPMPEWDGDFDTDPPKVNVRTKVGPWKGPWFK